MPSCAANHHTAYGIVPRANLLSVSLVYAAVSIHKNYVRLFAAWKNY